MGKPILCLDFDGVVHSYTSGWRGIDVIEDDPIEGVFDFIYGARTYFDVQIYSSRSSDPLGIEAMRKWYMGRALEWMLPNYTGRSCFKEVYIDMCFSVEFPTKKPAAFLSIDDRALTFTGKWPKIEDLLNFKPWNKE